MMMRGDWFTRFFASCMDMEPTPPAPPIIRIDDRLCLLFLLLSFEVDVRGGTVLLLIVSEYRPNLSYRASQAVIVVSGIAAASSKLGDFGFLPTIRSSTR
jgi:hypothetical protein